MKTVAVIPAYGRSTRIPMKNIKPFMGKPAIAYPIEAALNSNLFDAVIVSTDNVTIADTAIQYGDVRILGHPLDVDSAFNAVAYVLESYKKVGVIPEYVCCVYACNPFVTSNNLKAGYDMLRGNSYDFVVATTTYDFPVYRALRNHGNQVIPEFPNSIGKKSQELPELVHDVGQMYWSKANQFLTHKTPFKSPNATHKVGSVSIPRWEAYDIDTPEDWRVAELMYSAIYGK